MEDTGGVAKWKIKKQDVYLTPDALHEDAQRRFNIDTKNAFDPCPFPASTNDGLLISWQSPCFCNPPFSKARLWIQKAQEEAKNGVTTIMVLPWYCWYGGSACKRLLPPMQSRCSRTYKFNSPLQMKEASLHVVLVKIDNTGVSFE